MADNTENIVLEQLRLIRADLTEIRDDIADLKLGQQGQTAILIGLGKYIHDIDERVEKLEDKIGG